MDDWTWMPLGHVSQLSDKPRKRKKHPIGFQVPGGDEVTAYRERMKAGEYDAEPKKKPTRKNASWTDKTTTATRKTSARKTTTRKTRA